MDYENDHLEYLSETHRDFILAYVEFEQAREAAVVSQFLEDSQR